MKVTLHLEGNKDALVAGAQEFIKNLLGESEAPKKRGRPAKTVSDEEEESFGTKPLKKKDLKPKDEEEEEEEESEQEDESGEEEESEEEEEEEAEEEEEGSESEVSQKELMEAVNTYGEDHPDEMRAILVGFNIKNSKELKLHPKKWDAIYRKVQAKLTGLKKKKTKK